MITASILVTLFAFCAVSATLICCAILLKGPVAMAPEPKPCLGSYDNPHLVSTGLGENEIPYGDWCKCIRCGLVTKSTIAFRYTAEFQGGALQCEKCFMTVNDPNL